MEASDGGILLLRRRQRHLRQHQPVPVVEIGVLEESVVAGAAAVVQEAVVLRQQPEVDLRQDQRGPGADIRRRSLRFHARRIARRHPEFRGAFPTRGRGIR